MRFQHPCDGEQRAARLPRLRLQRVELDEDEADAARAQHPRRAFDDLMVVALGVDLQEVYAVEFGAFCPRVESGALDLRAARRLAEADGVGCVGREAGDLVVAVFEEGDRPLGAPERGARDDDVRPAGEPSGEGVSKARLRLEGEDPAAWEPAQEELRRRPVIGPDVEDGLDRPAP